MIVIDYKNNFCKDLCIEKRARGVNALVVEIFSKYNSIYLIINFQCIFTTFIKLQNF